MNYILSVFENDDIDTLQVIPMEITGENEGKWKADQIHLGIFEDADRQIHAIKLIIAPLKDIIGGDGTIEGCHNIFVDEYDSDVNNI